MGNKNQANEASLKENIKVWRLLHQTEFIISRYREQELAQYGITPEQTYVLDILVMNNGSTTLSHIVDITKRQHHSISTLVRRMEAQGLLTRVINPEDRRTFRVHITPKGEELFRSVPRDSINVIFGGLSDTEKVQLREGMARLLLRAYSVMGIPFPADIPGELSGMLPVETARRVHSRSTTNPAAQDHPVE